MKIITDTNGKVRGPFTHELSTEEIDGGVVSDITQAEADALAAQREAVAGASAQAFAAAGAIFDSLTPGKQALLEPIRKAVGDALKSGDFAKAAAIITTCPSVYPGMDEDRALFLAMFQ